MMSLDVSAAGTMLFGVVAIVLLAVAGIASGDLAIVSYAVISAGMAYLAQLLASFSIELDGAPGLARAAMVAQACAAVAWLAGLVRLVL